MGAAKVRFSKGCGSSLVVMQCLKPLLNNYKTSRVLLFRWPGCDNATYTMHREECRPV